MEDGKIHGGEMELLDTAFEITKKHFPEPFDLKGTPQEIFDQIQKRVRKPDILLVEQDLMEGYLCSYAWSQLKGEAADIFFDILKKEGMVECHQLESDATMPLIKKALGV